MAPEIAPKAMVAWLDDFVPSMSLVYVQNGSGQASGRDHSLGPLGKLTEADLAPAIRER